MTDISSDEDLIPPPNLTTLYVSSTGTPSFKTPETRVKKKKSWLSSIRKRAERVGMSTPGQASGTQAQDPNQGDAGGAGTQPPMSSGDTGGTVFIGAAAIPPQVLAVTAEENLPVWFKPFWEHLSAVLEERSVDLAEVRNDITHLKRMNDRLRENNIRTSGVEEGLASVESKLDKLISKGSEVSTHLQNVDKKLDEHDQRFDKMNQDIGRALAARPQTLDGGKAPSIKKQVTTAEDQSQTFWPGSVAPPPDLPPIGAAFPSAPSAGPAATAPEEEKKPDVGALWSSTMPTPTMKTVLGPAVPQLAPLSTIVQPFANVCDYRYYRLNDMSSVPTEKELKYLYKTVDKAKSYQPGLTAFDGSDPIALFEFLSLYKKAMNNLGKSEGIAVRALANLLTDDARDAYDIQVTSDFAVLDGPSTDSWPHVVQYLLETFISDDVLQQAYDDVVRARQKPKEHVSAFITRLQDLARRCHGVFPQAEMANMVMRGMKSSIRQRIQHAVNSLPEHERSSLPRIRQLAVREDNAQREQAAEQSASSTTGGKVPKRSGGKVMHIADPSGHELPSPPTTPTTSHRSTVDMPPQPENEAHNPQTMVNSAASLDMIFVISDASIQQSLDRSGLESKAIMKTMRDMPELTADQLDSAMDVIPRDYWRLSCWTCREHGHVTYTCPYLSPAQRIFAAHCYYQHQVKMNPQLKEWYEQKRAHNAGKGPAPGVRPGGGPPGGGRGGEGYYRGYGRPVVQEYPVDNSSSNSSSSEKE